MKIHYITPFSTDKNIGKEYNERISELPDDCYIVLRDGDTMFLRSDWGEQIAKIIEQNPEYSLITGVTNRIGLSDLLVKDMFDEDSIQKHIDKANELFSYDVKPCSVAPGMLMIFHKSVWQKIKFVENTLSFDGYFSQEVRRNNIKIGKAIGLYILHLYRYGHQNPRTYLTHLK